MMRRSLAPLLARTVPSDDGREKVEAMKQRMPKYQYGVSNEGYRMPHMTYIPAEVEEVNTHRFSAQGIRDKIASGMVKGTRLAFDTITRYDEKKMTKPQWVNRALFLETIAGVPGMVGGMVRHLNSLRRMERDNGWIHHLLEEAENERMHLFFFLTIREPGVAFRMLIAIAQGIFFNIHFLSYLLSPKFMHRFVGYLEEEAVHTYTIMLKDIDREGGPLNAWRTKPAPLEMAQYYNLPTETIDGKPPATYRDIILCIRADELSHREHNHLFADIHGTDECALPSPKIVILENGKGATPVAAAETTPKKE